MLKFKLIIIKITKMSLIYIKLLFYMKKVVICNRKVDLMSGTRSRIRTRKKLIKKCLLIYLYNSNVFIMRIVLSKIIIKNNG